MKQLIPKEVRGVITILEKAGFHAYIVGGCVRDLLMNKPPTDWDITTDAKPEDIQKLMEKAGLKTFYENEFFTVGVVLPRKELPKNKEIEATPYKLIEITTYRSEAKYTDKRHPDKIEFAKTLEEDLGRRDFTINALAIKLETHSLKLIDLFGGQTDLKAKLVRAVGSPQERFSEDALRLMRAVRIATKLEFTIEEGTKKAIAKKAPLIQFISHERVRDEFSKLLEAKKPEEGLELMHELGLMKLIAPEIEEGWNVGQNKHHIYTVWEHNMRALRHAADNKWDLVIRMAALLHDVGKPRSKQGEGRDSTFYGHEVIGAKMAMRLLSRLRYPKDFTEKVVKLVRYHLFYYNVDEVTDSSVRRLIQKVGPEDMENLIRVRICDRIGSGVPKAEPYKLRHFRFLVEKLARDPISVKMLKVNGNDIKKLAGIPQGPKIGFLLNILLEDVLDDPKKNQREYLVKRIKVLTDMSDAELQRLAKEAKLKSSALEEEEVGKIKQKHWVK